MTKQQELFILDAAIAKLGMDSYLGPWLKDVRASAEADMTNDVVVSPSLSHTRELCRDLVERTTKSNIELVAQAKAAADKTKREADVYVSNLRYCALHALRQALEKLN